MIKTNYELMMKNKAEYKAYQQTSESFKRRKRSKNQSGSRNEKLFQASSPYTKTSQLIKYSSDVKISRDDSKDTTYGFLLNHKATQESHFQVEKKQIRNLAKGGGGFSLLFHNRVQKQLREKIIHTQKNINNSQNSTMQYAFERSSSLTGVVNHPSYLKQMESNQVLFTNADRFNNQSFTEINKQKSDLSKPKPLEIISPYTPAPQRYSSMRPMSAAVRSISRQRDSDQAKMASEVITRNISSSSSRQVLQPVGDGQMVGLKSKELLQTKNYEIDAIEPYQAKGSRPKTATRVAQIRRSQYAQVNHQFRHQIKDHQKSLLNKSFRALSKNHQQQSSQQQIGEESHTPPQFFTKQIQMDLPNKNKLMMTQQYFTGTGSKKGSQQPLIDTNFSPGRFVAVVIPGTFVQDSVVDDENQFNLQRNHIFHQQQNGSPAKSEHNNQVTIMHRLLSNRK